MQCYTKWWLRQFLMVATHKVLMFLVRCFQIHWYNIHAVMAMTIVYHESTWFVRMVRILDIHKIRWKCLLPVETEDTLVLQTAIL